MSAVDEFNSYIRRQVMWRTAYDELVLTRAIARMAAEHPWWLHHVIGQLREAVSPTVQGPPQRAFAVYHPDIANAKVGDHVTVQEILLGPAQPCAREWHFWDADVLGPISGLDKDITFHVGP